MLTTGRAILALCLILPSFALAEDGPTNEPSHESWTATEEHVRWLIEAYRRADTAALEPQLADNFKYRNVGQESGEDGDGFLAWVTRTDRDFSDREMTFERVVVPASRSAMALGRWRAVDHDGDRHQLFFAISLAFDEDGKLVTWIDDFRPGRFDPT